jgi:hypothetical protein
MKVKKLLLASLLVITVALSSCDLLQGTYVNKNIPIEVYMGSDTTLSSAQGSKAIGIGADANVLSVEIKVINSQGAPVGSGTLTKNGSVWSGTITVSETGSLIFVGLAKDSLNPSASSAKTLYLGNGALTVSAEASNSVIISTGTTGESGSVLGMRGPAGGWIFFAKTQYDNTMPYFEYTNEYGDYMQNEDGVLTPIYHEDQDTDAGFPWRFLEVAPTSTEWLGVDIEGNETGKQWGAREEVGPAATTKALGAGKANTTAIVAFHASLDSFYEAPYYEYCDGTVAAKLCADLSYAGFDDWYLPSLDEAYLMYENLPKGVDEPSGSPISLTGFSDGGYWSSSENDIHSAWFMTFDYWNYANVRPGAQGKVANYNNTRAVRSF